MGGSRQVGQTTSHENPQSGLKIMYTNARSVVNKIQELKLIVFNVQPDIIALTETWTHENITNHYLSIPNYYIASRQDRRDTNNGRGGGIIIYVKDSIKTNEILIPTNFNQVACIDIITSSNHTTNLLVVYRSPNSTNVNNDLLLNLLQNVNKPTIVLGDFNFPSANWDDLKGCKDSEPFIETVQDKFWTQFVDFPTHKNGNILDLVLSERSLISNVIYDGQLGNSDHCVLMIETNLLHHVNQ